MAKLFTCKFDTNPLKPALNSYLKKAEKVVNGELNTASKNIASQAMSNCTIPSIRATITVNKVSGRFEISVGQGLSDPEIAAYHEFGTGDFARSLVGSLPEDWRLYAATFIKNGQGRLPASPYLYRAYWTAQRNLNLQEKINSI